MTPETSTNDALPSELSSIVRATDEERQVLLRRAFLIRHGETEWSLSGQHRDDRHPVDGERAERSRQLEPLLKGATFSLVLASPLRRARDLRDSRGSGGAQAEVAANLIQWSYGEYRGLTSKRIQARAPG